VVGENGAGKSTILQAAASIYRPESMLKGRFASDFFPDTAWDQVRNAQIRFAVREGDKPYASAIRKPTGRWRGNPERRQRNVEYIDLSRIQPVPARLGYMKLANPTYTEGTAEPFEQSRLKRLSAIMGRRYDDAKMATTNMDANRRVPVITQQGATYSGWHQGAGETTIAELLEADLPKYGLILIDEIESSLHPRAQRRLIRDLAERCRELELQVILTTHSPYVLEELPLEARAYILQTPTGRREIVYGVSPDFAMSRMDDVVHTECDLYVEDDEAATMLIEIMVSQKPDLVRRCRVIPYGAAPVGRSLGQMVAGRRFPRPSCVFLDGDAGAAVGCLALPGEDAPEVVVFEALQERDWGAVQQRVGRAFPDVASACTKAMAQTDHHDWVREAANTLVLTTDTLWHAMCAEWATTIMEPDAAGEILQVIEDALDESMPPRVPPASEAEVEPAPEEPERTSPEPVSPSGSERLF
jgi:predicted ATPase